MPVVPFHISSASDTARANGTVSDLTLPLTGALQIPDTATPRAWLSSLLFPNELANCTAATETSTISLGTGDSHVEWDNAGAARPYWMGLQFDDTDGALQRVCIPLTLDGSLPSEWQWTGQRTAGATGGFHGQAWSAMLTTVNRAIQTAFNSTPWRTATSQSVKNMPLPHSSAAGAGLFRAQAQCPKVTTAYVPGAANDTGSLVMQLNWGGAGITDAQGRQFNAALDKQQFRFMTQAEIRTYLAASGPAGYAHADALSIGDALGFSVDATGTSYTTRTVINRPLTYPATSYGWGMPATTHTATVTVPDMAGSIEDIEKAISRAVKADHAALWTAIGAQLPKGKLLADPDQAAQWTANQPVTGNYEKLVALGADIATNRVSLTTAGSLQVTSTTGKMATVLLGFAPEQLGAPTEASKTLIAANAARVDKNRAVIFHCPSLCTGSYGVDGRTGGSAMQMVPITAKLGEVQSWEASVPIKVECGIAGSTLAEIRCYLATEDGDPIEMLGDRWEAVIILEY
jgi:hypothetical protein